MPSAAPDLALLEDAAREAGAIARAAFGKKVETWSKGAAGPVTEVDLAIDKMLREKLLAARPDYGWLSEESGEAEDRIGHERVFVIDPIDGTQAFLQREPQFTISIGLVHNTQAVAGAVYNPMTDQLYLGAVGGTATLNGRSMSVSDQKDVEGARMIGQKKAFQSSDWPAPWPPMEISSRQSIALRLALVASGGFDAVILFGLKHEWDVAAGAALVEAAGGRATDPWGRALEFNQPDARLPGVVAAGAALQPLLLERTSHLRHPKGAQTPESTP